MKTFRSCFLAAAAAALGSAAAAQTTTGSLFPPLSQAALSGSLPATAGKIVLVDFWASWCAPCRASFPAYSKLQEDYASRGVVILAVGVDDAAPAYSAFVAKLKPSFAVVHDAGHKLVAEVQVPTMPTSYLLDRSGRVRFMHAGFRGDSTIRELRGEIDALLKEGSNP